MFKKVILISVLVFGLSNCAFATGVKNESSFTPEYALKQLMDGNKRFASEKTVHPDQAMKRVIETSTAQHPFAVIIACSDSRVSPEVIFDQGLGDIFVIREAGNVLDTDVLASIEYAIEHLHTPLVMVLGHEKCGAVTAALSNHKAEGHIGSLLKRLQPAIKRARLKKGDLLDNAIRENVFLEVQTLKRSEPIIAKLVKSNKVKIVGGYYCIDDGTVSIISK